MGPKRSTAAHGLGYGMEVHQILNVLNHLLVCLFFFHLLMALQKQMLYETFGDIWPDRLSVVQITGSWVRRWGLPCSAYQPVGRCRREAGPLSQKVAAMPKEEEEGAGPGKEATGVEGKGWGHLFCQNGAPNGKKVWHFVSRKQKAWTEP